MKKLRLSDLSVASFIVLEETPALGTVLGNQNTYVTQNQQYCGYVSVNPLAWSCGPDNTCQPQPSQAYTCDRFTCSCEGGGGGGTGFGATCTVQCITENPPTEQ